MNSIEKGAALWIIGLHYPSIDRAEKAYLNKLDYLKEIQGIEGKRRWKSEAVTYHQLGRVAEIRQESIFSKS